MLQPFKQIVRRALERSGVIEPTVNLSSHELRQFKLEQSCAFFRDMAALPGIAGITFDSENAIVTLADGRRYYFDYNIKAARLYGLPFTGTFEPDETAFVSQYIQPNNICIDVGANFGWFTVLLSQLAGKAGRVHAFEPIADTAALLKRNIELNGCDNVDINTLALDDTEAKRDIFVPDIGVSGSFALHEYRDDFDTQTVTTTTLDHYVESAKLDRVDFIKADIEGAEFSMLRGAERTLERFHPTLMLEVQASSTRLFNYEPADLATYLARFGYHPYVMMAQGDIKSIPSIDEADGAYNFVFKSEAQSLANVA